MAGVILMRTDVKIGVGMGLLLVLALVGWQLVWNEKEPSPDANSPDGKRLATGPGQNGDGPSPSNPNRGLPRFGHVPGEIPVSPRIVESDGPVIPSIRETPEPPVIPSIREMPEPPPVTPVIPSIRETPEPPPVTPVIPSIRETPEPPPVTPVIPSIRETPPVTPVIPSIRETPIMPFGPPAPGAGGTYEVQKGDSGFWAIAAKVYGDGRQWTLIAKANPGMDSNALRPGAKLIIPPKPVTRTETPDAAGMVPGEIVLSPSGQRQYVVKKGDSGFWAVSKAVYGNGKHWALIAEANPNADSNRLHPGDTLVIPDRAPATTTGTGASDPRPRPSRRAQA